MSEFECKAGTSTSEEHGTSAGIMKTIPADTGAEEPKPKDMLRCVANVLAKRDNAQK